MVYGGTKSSEGIENEKGPVLEYLQLDMEKMSYQVTYPECVLEDYGNFPEIVIPASQYELDMQMLAHDSNAYSEIYNPFSDVVFEIVTEDRSESDSKHFVKAYKSLLAQRSDRFKALFYGGMSEATMGSKPILIYGTNENTFRALLEYLYSDSICVARRSDHNLIMELLVLGNEYMLDRLVRLCEGILLRLLEVENSAEFLDFADRYGLSTLGDFTGLDKNKDSFVYCGSILREGCISFILQHFSDVLKTQGYLELPENLKEDLSDRFKDSVYSSNMVNTEDNGVMALMNRAE